MEEGEGAAHGAVPNGNSAAAAPGFRATPASREPEQPLAALCMSPPALLTCLQLVLAQLLGVG